MCAASETPARGTGAARLSARLSARLRGFHGDRGGQISMLTVLVAVVLASLLGLVVSTGDQVTQKLEMQNAADAAALSGGAWIARGMNVVSGFNLLQSQLMAAAILLRGLDSALEGIESMLNRRIAKLRLCLPFCSWLLSVNELYRAVLAGIHPFIHGLKAFFAGCPPEGAGIFWLIGKGLQVVNGLVVEYVEVIALIEARDVGLRMGAEAVSFVSGPVLRRSARKPTLPLRKGEVIDHCDPMDFGSPERRRHGFHLFAGYPIGKGPFNIGRGRVRPLIWAVSGFPWGPAFQIFDSRLNQVKSAVYAERECGDLSPRPHLLDAGDEGLLYLAVARRSNRKLFFRTDRLADPPTLYTYAQIEIYNATNPAGRPDTYTQDWRARLAPASLIASPITSPVSFPDPVIADFARLFLGPGSLGAAQLAGVGHH